MSDFKLKSFPQIVSSMAAKIVAETPITDLNDGSVILTLLEAAAQEDFQQYVQMLNILRNFNLNTTEGVELDKRAAEFGITRLSASAHSGFVTIEDNRFAKISTKLYAGLSGPTSGSLQIFVDDASAFPASGELYVGRGTSNSEGPIAYSAVPVDFGAYWEITLDTALINDHGTDETVILSQLGNRIISAGTEVMVPETDYSEKILFELNQTVELLDGENTLDNVLVTALEVGGYRVPANAIVAFSNPPFSGAVVYNSAAFINGRDVETDQQLRDRIRQTVQSLSRGVKQAIKTGIIGLVDERTNSSIVSANVISPVILADGPTKVYIDNGRGLEPELDSIGLEVVLTLATGGEQFFQLKNFPIVKASVVSQNVENFALYGGETLIINVGADEETFTFASSDFEVAGRAKATEISEAINNRATLVEARTILDDDGRKILLTPKSDQNENMRIDTSSTSQAVLNFPTREVQTLKLYKNDILLNKDGVTASVLSLAQPFNLSTEVTTTTDSDITVTAGSRIIEKSALGNFPFKQFLHPGDYIKFSTDNDTYYTKVRTVVSNVKAILDVEYPVSGGGTGNIIIWNSPQLEVSSNGDLQETEVVTFSPNDFANASQALASEVFERLQSEINLSSSELSVNNTKIKLISNLENSINSKMQVLGGGASSALGFTNVASLSGLVQVIGGNNTVFGNGTLFLSELQEGQWIKCDADGQGSWTKIETIESDTVLYLTEGYRGKNYIDVSASKIEFGELVSGKNKDYVLNRFNGQIELSEPLEPQDKITAGSINTRALVDSLQETFDFNSLGSTSRLIVAVDGGFAGTTTTGDILPPYNGFIASNLIGYAANLFTGFYIKWVSGNNVGESDYIISYNSATGSFITSVGFSSPIQAGDHFILAQTINFNHTLDFTDSQNVTAEEVVNVINSQIFGGLAERLDTGAVRIRTSNFGYGEIEIIGGSANNVLSFSTENQVNQLTNLAYVASNNNDRSGISNFLGFTLGPNQNLVTILDDDSANKTFAPTLQVEGEVSSGGTSSFQCSALAPKYTSNDYFKDFWLYWLNGANEGAVQVVTGYTAVTGTLQVSNVFPSSIGSISVNESFALVPRTVENVAQLLNDFNTTTFSIFGSAEGIGVSGDYLQLSSKTAGSKGKVFVTGGTANSLGISIVGIPAGAPTNDMLVNSIAGLSKGLPVYLTVDATITEEDIAAPYNTFKSSSLISAFPNYFDGQQIEFLSGFNAGFKTSVASYDNTDGSIILSESAVNSINLEDEFRIYQAARIVDISGTSAPYTVQINDESNVAIDASVYTVGRKSALRDMNGLNFNTIQVEGVDGYKYFTGLIQEAQWTIDGLDRDSNNYPGIAAAGTQFEVLSPVIVKVKLTINIVTDEGISLSSISNSIINAISEYVNSREVGADVVLSEVIAAAQSVNGVFDVEILNHSGNIVIADNELARVETRDIVVG